MAKAEGGLTKLPIRMSRLLGKAFLNEEHEQLGSVRDFVTDPSGGIGYVLVAYGGTLGIGEKLVPVPWEAVKIYHSGNDYVISVNISKENFEKAPYLFEKEWANFAATDWEGHIREYYARVPKQAEIH